MSCHRAKSPRVPESQSYASHRCGSSVSSLSRTSTSTPPHPPLLLLFSTLYFTSTRPHEHTWTLEHLKTWLEATKDGSTSRVPRARCRRHSSSRAILRSSLWDCRGCRGCMDLVLGAYPRSCLLAIRLFAMERCDAWAWGGL